MSKFLSKPTRRTFLQATASAAALPLAACDPGGVADPDPTPTPTPPAPGRSPEPEVWEPAATVDMDLFPCGVQSGDPTANAAIVWTKYLGAAALTLELVVADGDAGWQPERELAVEPDDVGVVKLDVDGLDVDTAYAYTFVDADGRRSLSGRLRTAPTAARVVVFGASCCTRDDQRPFPCLSWALPERLDFHGLLGDTVYADSATTSQAYQEVWADNYAAQGYLDLRRSTPTVMTWDDNEVINNNVGEWNVSPERYAIASEEFWRHNTARPDPAAPGRIWRRLSFGPAADLFVLDCRSERDVAAGHYISPEQMDWLKAGLASSTAVFKFVMNTVPISDITGQPASDGFLDVVKDDRWEGFPEQRDEILDHIADQGLTGVIWLAGDLHFGAAMTVEPEGERAAMNEILVGPAGNGGSNPLVQLFELAPPFRFFTEWNNWVRFEADPGTRTCRLAFVGEDGEEMYSETLSA